MELLTANQRQRTMTPAMSDIEARPQRLEFVCSVCLHSQMGIDVDLVPAAGLAPDADVEAGRIDTDRPCLPAA